MNVWLVTQEYEYEGSTPLGVFATAEAAWAWIATQPDTYGGKWAVEEYTVQS